MVIAVAAQGAPQFKTSHTIKSKAVITHKMVTKPEVKGDMRNAVVKTKDGICVLLSPSSPRARWCNTRALANVCMFRAVTSVWALRAAL